VTVRPAAHLPRRPFRIGHAAGALIGIIVGQNVAAHNQQRRSGKMALIPDITPAGLAGASRAVFKARRKFFYPSFLRRFIMI